MTKKPEPKESLEFLKDYSVDDLKQALAGAAAELAQERGRLLCIPSPLEDADKRLLGTKRTDLTTVDLTRWRISFWEGVQDRLWNWYRTKSGQATGSERQGGSSLG